jgi:hypothetical protein
VLPQLAYPLAHFEFHLEVAANNYKPSFSIIMVFIVDIC